MMGTMYDSTDRHLFPSHPFAVAGYGGAHDEFQSYAWFVLDYPDARHVLILTSAADDAPPGVQDVALDLEMGDATPSQAVAWLRRQWARGVARPILYAPLSWMQQIYAYLRAAGIAYCTPGARVRIWTSHPTGRGHICGPACGFSTPARGVDGTQHTWSPNEVNIDVSLLRDDFFASPTPPPPTPPEDTVNGPYPYTLNDHRVGFVVGTDAGEVKHIEQQGPSGVTGQSADWWRNKDGTANWLSLGHPAAASAAERDR